MRAQAVSHDANGDPLTAVEEAAEALGWSCLRSAPEELLLAAELASLNVQFMVQWQEGDELLQIMAMWDLRIPPARLAEATALAWLVNARLPLGHFEVWENNGTVVLRHAQLLSAPAQMNDQALAQRLLERLADICVQFHPAFQFVVWAGKTAQQALESCLFETLGEA